MSKMGDTGRQLLGIILGGACVLGASCVTAQITPDRTLPNNSSVTINGSVFNITGGTQAGRNLFHSFQQFSVPNGGTAIFQNTTDIQNIFSRVTGGSVSNIDGLIRANGTANLFLINPNGIIFGQGASLNIGGSFVGTTASSLKFADGFEFSATSPKTTPLLTISIPLGLQFGSAMAASIVNQSQSNLQVQPGKTLALIGGDVKLNGGTIFAPNGRVELGAVAGVGMVGLNLSGDRLSLSVPDSLPRADISLTNAAAVDVTDLGAGSVAINARNLEILGGSKIAAGISPGLMADSSQPGNITFNTTGLVTINHKSRVTNLVGLGATGNAGDINIVAANINIDNRASTPRLETDKPVQAALDTGALGQGRAGNISLSATGSITLIGQNQNLSDSVISTASETQKLFGGDITLQAFGSISLSNAYLRTARGNGGNILLSGNDSVSIKDDSFLDARTNQGNSGNITVTSNGPVTIQSSWLSNNVQGKLANAGNIKISGSSVFLTDESLLESSAGPSSGSSGNITISATNQVEISSNNPCYCTRSYQSDHIYGYKFENSALTTRPNPSALGNAGDINITATAGDIYVDNRFVKLNPDNPFAPAVDAGSGNYGRAGNISLSATGSITLIGQDIDSNHEVISTYFRGSSTIPEGGDITLTANNGSISLLNAYVDASRGNRAGNISLFGFESVSIADNSYLNTGTEQGNSGNITVTSNGPISIDRSILGNNVVGKGNNLVGGIPGNAGDINISGRSISIKGGSLVESRSEQEAFNSGNIRLNATDQVEISGYDDHFTSARGDRYLVPYTTLTTTTLSGSLGRAGEISVNTPTIRVSDGAILRADSQSAFNGGNININAKVVELRNGGQLFTNASNSGNAGNVNLNVSDRIVIDGTNSNFDRFNDIANTLANSDDPVTIFVPDNPSSGIFASTRSSQGGNITLEAPKLLLLRRNGQISAKSDNNGNGGNITINAPNGLIVAIPEENSDILANANQGSGGQIRITTSGIYGLENRSQQPPDPTISEINASSQFGAGGIVQLNTPEVDKSRSVVALPTFIENTPKLVSARCAAFADSSGSSFTVTGRGGLPPNPDEPLTSDVVWTDTRLPVTTEQHQRKTHATKPKPQPIAIIPATGWVFNDKGDVTLISSVANTTTLNTPTSCPVR